MQPDETDTFAQWRIWIIKTLDKLSTDVDSLKTVTSDRAEYLRRFEVVERDLVAVKDRIAGLDISTAVSKTTLAIYSAVAAFVGSAATAVLIKIW